MTLVNPAAQSWLAALPERFRQGVAGGVEVAVRTIGDLEAVAIVGSLAEGTWDEQSDTDFLFIRQKRTGDPALGEIKRRWPPVSFIVGTRESLAGNYAEGNDAAWSVRRGVPVYDPRGVLKPYMGADPPLPQRAWVQQQAARALEWTEDRLQTWRILHLAQLLVLLRQRELLTTKRAIRDAFLAWECSSQVVRAVRLAYDQRMRLHFEEAQRRTLQTAAEALYHRIQTAMGRAPCP